MLTGACRAVPVLLRSCRKRHSAANEKGARGAGLKGGISIATLLALALSLVKVVQRFRRARDKVEGRFNGGQVGHSAVGRMTLSRLARRSGATKEDYNAALACRAVGAFQDVTAEQMCAAALGAIDVGNWDALTVETGYYAALKR